jgi:hypothetical protein
VYSEDTGIAGKVKRRSKLSLTINVNVKLDFLGNIGYNIHCYALVAQLDRVVDFESNGRRFDSCQAHQKTL